MLLKQLFLLFLQYSAGAKILGYFCVPSISHQNFFQPIWKQLSLRGHNVTIITPNPLNDPSLTNLTEIDVSASYEFLKTHRMDKIMSINTDRLEQSRGLINLGFEMIKFQLNLKEVQKILKDQRNQFDLVLIENSPLLFFGLSHRYNAPLIGLGSLAADLYVHDTVGNPSHPISHPDHNLRLSGQLTFSERWFSTFFSIWVRYYMYFFAMPEANKYIKKYFSKNMPYLDDIKPDLIFINANPVLHPVRPTVPTIIELRLIHIKPKLLLPNDLQDFLDAATEGVVYFSLGTNVQSINLDIRLRHAITSALGELPYKVIWKWESDHMPEKPNNVLIRKWLPQQDLLGHPNVKVFVTQGGLQSLEEAVVNEVPIVGLPFMGDQPMNIARVVEKGFGIGLDINTLTKNELKKAIVEVAENKKYKETIKELHDILVDEPMKGIEKAMWWIEYVIRHNGTKHLRCPTADLPLYQYYLLDVIGATLLSICLMVYILYKISVYCLMLLSRVIQNKRKED